MNSRKIIVLGIDAFNQKLLEMDELYDLRKFFDENLSTTLFSVHPPTTDAAWTSFQTGVTPDEHGLCGFVDFKSKKQPLYSRNDIKYPTFYDLIKEKGHDVFLFNLPFTYPPSIAGDIVYSWVDHGYNEDEPYYPLSLNKRYKKLKNIEVFPDKTGSPIDNLKEMRSFFEKRIDIIEEILESSEYDLYFFLISITDWIQHNCFNDLVSGKKNKKTKIAREILSNLNGFFSRLVSKINLEKDILIVLSDHGFEMKKRVFNLNTWLLKKGFLRLSNEGKTISNVMRGRINRQGKKEIYLGKIGDWLREHPSVRNNLSFIEETVRKKMNLNFSTEKKIDIDNSKAICFSTLSRTIFINEGHINKKELIKNKIIHELNQTKGVNSYKINDIFDGDNRGRLGDILVKYNGAISKRIEEKVFQKKIKQQHSYEGVICLAGKPFNKIYNSELQITNFYPIILNLFDIDIPSTYCGNIPKKVFTKDYLCKNPFQSPKREKELIKQSSKMLID